ncbi:MAG: tetratricopeptide repeat protein [Terrimicrobiaceae bacterium]
MKSRPVFAVILLLALQVLTAGADALTDARARFADGEYEQATKLFEQALEKSPPSAAVFFELGRALNKSGQEARAALNFRRALILDPRFAPARSALQEANVALGIAPSKPDWRAKVLDRIPMDALTLAGTILFWVGAFCCLAAFMPPAFRGLRLVCGLFFLAAGLATLALVWSCDPRITLANTAVVLTTGGTSLLSSPADQSEKIATLPQGSQVKILSQRGRWFYGELPGGAHGWFLTEGIVPLIPPA